MVGTLKLLYFIIEKSLLQKFFKQDKKPSLQNFIRCFSCVFASQKNRGVQGISFIINSNHASVILANCHP